MKTFIDEMSLIEAFHTKVDMDIEKKCLDIEWCVNPMHLRVVKKKTLLLKAYKFDMTVRL